VGDGPVNTDDLPLTYYDTRYSKPFVAGWAGFFVEPMEDIWPRLTGTGSEASAESLHHELDLRAKVNRLAFSGRLEEAYAVLPEDVRFQKMRRCYEKEGPAYTDGVISNFWNNPQGLVYQAALRNDGPNGAQATRLIYERALALDPDNVSALSALGGICSDAGEAETAEKCLTKAARLDPDFGAAQYNLALLLDRTGRHPEALQQYEKAAAVSTDPMFDDVWGVCLAQAGRSAEAVQWFRKAVEIRPTEIPPRLHLAYSLEQMGQTQEALTHARYLVKLDPENRTFLNLQAELEARAALHSKQ
jgi:tetratricopeptide (TPR) repeat protein